jgi:hypothetical protein
MKNHGQRLREFIQDKDLSFLQVTRRLGHGSKTTLHNWFERDELNMNMFSQLVKVFPDIMNHFPEIEWKRVSSMVEEEAETYGTNGDTKCEKRLDRLLEDHLDLLKRFNQLMQNHVELTQNYGQLQEKYLKSAAP